MKDIAHYQFITYKFILQEKSHQPMVALNQN